MALAQLSMAWRSGLAWAVLVLLARIPSARSDGEAYWRGKSCTDSSIFVQSFDPTPPPLAFKTFPAAFKFLESSPSHAPVSIRLALGPGHQLGFSTWDLVIRSNTSDFAVMVQHFCTCELCELASRLRLAPGYVHSILDLGGNIGAAALVMASVFPRASIVSVEPGTSTYKMLSANVGRHPRITSILGAAWPKTTFITFAGQVYDRNQTQEIHDWGTAVGPVQSALYDSEDLVPAYSIDFIISKHFPNKVIDIVKIDIEGGEVALFNAAATHTPTWLHAVRCLVIEWHAHQRTKEHYEKFHSWLNVYGFEQLPDFGEHEAWCRKAVMVHGANPQLPQHPL